MSASTDWKKTLDRIESGRFHVIVELSDDSVRVQGYREHSCSIREDMVELIIRPNWVERLFGITYAHKVEKAKIKMQKKCDEVNANIDYYQKIAQKAME